MKNLTKTLLTTALILGLPLGANAGSEAVATAQLATATMGNSPMDGGDKHHGCHHEKMASMTAEEFQASLQQRYDSIQDPAMKAEFIKTLELHVDGKTQHADVMKQFVETHQ